MLIAQDLFLGRLIQSRHTRLIKVVTGIRDVESLSFLQGYSIDGCLTMVDSRMAC